MKNKKKWLYFLFTLPILAIGIYIIFRTEKVLVDENQFACYGYSKLELYQDATINNIPKYIKKNKLKQKNGFSSRTLAFSVKNKTVKSKIVVSENPIGFQYQLISKNKKNNSDKLKIGFMSLKDNKQEIYEVIRVSDGYIIVLVDKANNYILEKIDNNFSYLWTYDIKNNNNMIFNDIKDIYEYKNKYYIAIDYVTNGFSSAYILLLNDKGELISKDYSYDNYFDSYFDYLNGKVYFDKSDGYSYFDLERGKVSNEINKIGEYSSDQYEHYHFLGIDNNIYYSGISKYYDDGSEAEKYLIKLKLNGEIEKELNLSSLIKKLCDNKNVSISEIKYREDRIIVNYYVYNADGEGIYDGILLLDDNFDLIKHLCTNQFSETLKELKNDDIYSINNFMYKDGNLYVVYDLETCGSLYVKYDSQGNYISSNWYDYLYGPNNGGMLVVVFDENEIINYQSFDYDNNRYLKIVKVSQDK